MHRRTFLSRISAASIALPWLLERDGLLAAEAGRTPVKPAFDAIYDLTPKAPPHGARATAMIDLFQFGGPSQMDLFDPKPLLTKRHAERFPGEVSVGNTAGNSGLVFGSPWRFGRHGQCGMDVSELLPETAKIVDDLCHLRGMQFGTNAHDRGAYLANTCGPTPGRPVLGSWLTFALGSENDSLPAYVSLTAKGGLPYLNEANWHAGYLPNIYQGTQVRNAEPRVLNLDPPPHLAGQAQQSQLALLQKLNQSHYQQHPAELDLQARIASYGLAARMQQKAKEAFNLADEPEHIRRLYGLDNPDTSEYGERCLIARRLVERGVRFVQLLHDGNGDIDWDSHGRIIKGLPQACLRTDRGTAALVIDLKQRGLLDTTIVRWGGEMGRLPTAEGASDHAAWGRDHNGKAGCMWMAGGGFRAGLIHGETDEWGHEAVDGIVTAEDWHATVLHQFGLDHEALTYKADGQSYTLTDGKPARVLHELLA
ncbi:hypothetical protein Pla175_30820 [Pirellulimonas nuda]|uniref:Sulfatase n=1 Tax=Pirellulimonas nuda TaxID=2528009 RepID=A0A518DDY8_9BACT|nr:DUF1501 domain-containing protein [Pirellulimonas nuda]QDU89687.1 hypothetical protein Pla175_30820 [Pirellulimonas nuda]